MIHYFALRVCELDVDWKLACSVEELMSFVFKIKPIEKLSSLVGHKPIELHGLTSKYPARQQSRYTSVPIKAAVYQ
jgi:hypothetical protein